MVKKTAPRKPRSSDAKPAARPPETMDDYFAVLAPEARKRLTELRKLVHKTVSGLEEGLTYKIPVFRLKGRQVVSIAAAKNHYALYLIQNNAVLEKFRPELEGYETGKGVVKFSPDEPFPVALIAKLVKAAASS